LHFRLNYVLWNLFFFTILWIRINCRPREIGPFNKSKFGICHESVPPTPPPPPYCTCKSTWPPCGCVSTGWRAAPPPLICCGGRCHRLPLTLRRSCAAECSSVCFTSITCRLTAFVKCHLCMCPEDQIPLPLQHVRPTGLARNADRRAPLAALHKRLFPPLGRIANYLALSQPWFGLLITWLRLQCVSSRSLWHWTWDTSWIFRCHLAGSPIAPFHFTHSGNKS